MEGGEGEDHRRDGSARWCEAEMARQQVRKGRREWEGEEDEPVVGGNRARDSSDQCTWNISEGLGVDAITERTLELCHHGEWIVMPADNLHAEDAVGRRAQHRPGHDHGDNRGDSDDDCNFSDASGHWRPPRPSPTPDRPRPRRGLPAPTSPGLVARP